MTLQTIVVMLGILSSITLILSSLSVRRARLLTFSIATSLLVAVQYFLVGSVVALGSLGVGLSWTITTLLSLKFTSLQSKTKLLAPIFIAAHIIVFSLLSNWDAMTVVDFVPVLGGTLGVIAISFKEVIFTKAFLVGIGLMWITYQYQAGVYGQMVGESLNIIANSSAFLVLLKARRAGVPESAIENLDTQIINTITNAVPIQFPHTTSIILPDGEKQRRPTEGVHLHSVQYQRKLAEHDRELAKRRESR